MLLEEMKRKYLNNVQITLSDGTYRCYKCHLDYICNWLFSKKVFDDSQINIDVMSKFILSQHYVGVKNSTINKRIKPFKLMFKFNNIDNEIFNVAKLKEDKTTFTALSKFELNTLVVYLNRSKMKLQNRLLIFLLVDTGMRVNELLNIKVQNINFSNNTILLETTKNKISRFVPFTDATAVLLKEYLFTCSASINLFNLKYSTVRSLFVRIQKHLNFSKFHPHMLRHTLASKLHSNGVSVLIIKEIMGHTNVSTTERYIHFDLDDMLKSYNSVMM